MRALADLLFPRECAVCRRHLLSDERFLCIWCLEDLPLTHSWLCRMNEFSERMNALLQERLESWEPFTCTAALFYYDPDNGYSRLTREVKYNGNVGLGLYLGKMIGEKLMDSELFRDVDLIIPVPLHWTRKIKRGYNQAEILARGISTATGWKVEPGLLVRHRRTVSQTTLNREEKLKNVEGAFCIDRKHLVKMKDRPHHILIVDDVLTTGATMAGCQRALRKIYGNDVRISCAAAAGVR